MKCDCTGCRILARHIVDVGLQRAQRNLKEHIQQISREQVDGYSITCSHTCEQQDVYTV